MPVGFLISASGGLDAEVLAVAQQIEEIVRAG
jgi:hypothetical protein